VDYLTLVQQSMYKAGLRSENPSTLSGAIDIVLDFKVWVQDAWRELQEESTNWWFRAKLDQTLAITASTDTYAMPTGLETINYRTATIYTVAQQDEQLLTYLPYEEWRQRFDTVASAEGRPIYITETPDMNIILFPTPDQAYTLHYDGVWDIDAMVDDTDTPGFQRTGATTLLERHQWILVYDAALRYAEHHQDAASIARLQPKYLAQHERLVQKRTPPISIPAGVLTGLSRNSNFRRFN